MRKTIGLIYMEILNERCVLEGNDKWTFLNYVNGHEGESQFEEIAVSVLPNGMVLLMDLVFEMGFVETQIDGVILSENTIHCFEVKNLKSQYEYVGGTWKVNGKEKIRNYFTQMDRASEIFELVLKDLNIRAELNPKLVLINEEDTTTIRDPHVDGRYLKRWQLKDYIRKLGHNQDWRTKWDPQELGAKLRERANVRVVPKQRPVDVDVKKVYRGIVCCHCGGYQIDVSGCRYHVACQNCGYHESKEKAVLRTVCDLAILDYDEPLRIGIMEYYLGKGELVGAVRVVFRKYFKAQSIGRFAEYKNPMKRMGEAFPELKFKYLDYLRE